MTLPPAAFGPFAHSLPGKPTTEWETLVAHLDHVACLAAERAGAFGWAELARLAGRLHDIGKTSAQFQAYIRGQGSSGGDHATAGAREAERLCPPQFARMLALVIAGHHSGLADAPEIERRLAAQLPPYDGWEAHAGLLPAPADLRPTRSLAAAEAGRGCAGFTRAFLVRMLFSCLVDADFIATETFVQGRGQKLPRGGGLGIEVLRDRLRAHMQALGLAAKPSALNALRQEILEHAVARAGEAPGFFTLTVPTGGGKTLASLRFALEHAVLRAKRRVIVVAPFTAIIEQTAQVYREALGDPTRLGHVVLEHHATFDWERAEQAARADGGDERDGLGRLRRAAENWDAPVIVTTAVQFFESLFASRTSRCRKLHNIADSVVVLDEAQTLPRRLLLPCLAALDELQRNYGASVVLCTATQPAWRQLDRALLGPAMPGAERANLGLAIDEARELAPRPRELYVALRRVQVEVLAGPVPDDVVVAAFARAPQMLCIVNTRRHARALFERVQALEPEAAFHLTTLMCPAHRRLVLSCVRTRLRAGLPVRLVATSLVEAGVDFSFPEVWRASTGLDSVAQAAGRCNREGERLPALGRVVVFTPAEETAWQDLQDVQQAAASALRDHADPLSLDAMAAYFRRLYAEAGLEALDATCLEGREKAGILPALRAAEGLRFPFRSIAEAFRLVEEEGPPVLVPWSEQGQALLDRLERGHEPLGPLLRQLQSYVVSVPPYAQAKGLQEGWLVPARRELGRGVLRVTEEGFGSRYTAATGLDLGEAPPRTAAQNVFA